MGRLQGNLAKGECQVKTNGGVFWIPACAGMTVWWERNDGVAGLLGRCGGVGYSDWLWCRWLRLGSA